MESCTIHFQTGHCSQLFLGCLEQVIMEPIHGLHVQTPPVVYGGGSFIEIAFMSIGENGGDI